MFMAQSHEGLLAYQHTQKAIDKAREETLLNHHMGLVRSTCRYLSAQANNIMSLEDMEQIGLIALIEVIRRHTDYDDNEIELVAKKRIRGAILDELRRQDWRSRQTRQRSNELQDNIRQLSRSLGREPTASELSQQMGISIDEVFQRKLDNEAKSLDSYESELEQSSGQLDFIYQSNGYDKEKLVQALKQALGQLSEREQQILMFYYEHEMNLKEIALAFDLSEARISQLHSKAVKRLNALLTDWQN